MKRFWALLLLTMTCCPAQAGEPAAGAPAPEFVAEELNGSTVDLSKLKGEVVLVHFWATWCLLCHEEAQALDKFYRAHHKDGLEIIGVSLDRYSDRDKVKAFMQSYAFSSAMVDDAHPNGFGVPSAIPLTYVIDRKGIIRLAVSPDLVPLNQHNLDGSVLPMLLRK